MNTRISKNPRIKDIFSDDGGQTRHRERAKITRKYEVNLNEHRINASDGLTTTIFTSLPMVRSRRIDGHTSVRYTVRDAKETSEI